MNPRAVCKNILLLFVGVCIGAIIAEARKPAQPGGSRARGDEPEALANHVAVYYFHGDKRCDTCNGIERQARQALEAAFAGELQAGALVWRVRNRQDPENRRLVREFGLLTNAVVVERVAGGERAEWKDLAKIWDLLDDGDGFADYIQGEAGAFLDRRSMPGGDRK